MATNFPTSKDDGTSLPYPTALSARTTPSLAGLSDNQNDAIIAVQNKIGTGASTPTNNKLFIGTGTGTSAWTKTAPTGEIVGTTDSQTLTNKIFTSPTINSPVISNATITTDLIEGFTDSDSGTIFGITVTNGSLAFTDLTSDTITADTSLTTSTVITDNVTEKTATAGVGITNPVLKVSATYGESLTAGDVVYFKSDGKVWKADANGTGTYPCMGIALETESSGSHLVQLHGIYNFSAAHTDFTVGGVCYLSTDAGVITQTQPTATDNVIQVLGIATGVDSIYFNPSLTWVTHT